MKLTRKTNKVHSYYVGKTYLGELSKSYGGWTIYVGHGYKRKLIDNPDSDHGAWFPIAKAEEELVRLAIEDGRLRPEDVPKVKNPWAGVA